MEEKLNETSQALVDEEEKAKSLAKQKAKQDAVIADLEERLRNEERARQELEKIRRKLEAELADVSRQLEEAKQQVCQGRQFFWNTKYMCFFLLFFVFIFLFCFVVLVSICFLFLVKCFS